MSTDAFFFFHMDPENRRGEPSSAPPHQPIASTSSSSIVSLQDQTRFLVEYSPKPTRVMYTPPQPVAAESSNSQAIHRWLAGQRPYTHIPDSERSSFSSSESEAGDDASSTSSESESDEDQIYLRPRRQHSSPSIAMRRSSPAIAASVSPAARRAWPVSAAKPALPVLDLREATAFTSQEQDKSHWSDDEEDFAEDEEEWAEDDDDLPALDADVDTGAASSSTRSLPIPIFNPSRTRSQPLVGAPLQKSQNDFDALWDASYQSPVGRRAPCKAIQIQEGQSFYTPWIAGYIAQNN